MKIVKIVLGVFLFLVIVSGVIYFKINSKINSSQVSSQNGITSILILGKGGEGHTAPDLTDTIMVAYLNINERKVTFVSFPRDIWIPEMRAKLNSSYYWGKQKGGNGFDLASSNIESITDIPVNYSLTVDFSVFRDVIDAIGGIEVQVDNSFVDEKYPISGKENDLCSGDKLYKCRYETVKFDKGNQKMDGETALKFVRSRNAQGDEGTDLARERRQQKVIAAIKNKVLSSDVLLNKNILTNLYEIAVNHIETNIDQNSILGLGKLIFLSRNDIKFLSIPEDQLIVSQNDKRHDYQYVFVPKGGNWEEFQKWLKGSI